MNPYLNEAETRAELIDPDLAAAGWGKVEHSRVRREVISPGRLLGGSIKQAWRIFNGLQANFGRTPSSKRLRDSKGPKWLTHLSRIVVCNLLTFSSEGW